MNASIARPERTELGEGPLWDADRRCLWLVDIMRGEVQRFDPAAKTTRVYPMGQPVSALALSASGPLVCAVRDGFAWLNVDTGAVTPFVDVEKDNTRNRMNDGYVDAKGRVWAGTMSMHHEREQGALYRLDPDGRVTQHLTGVTTSNGIDWNGANTRMYYIDTGRPQIDVFDFDLERGAIANRRKFAAVDPAHGRPDGLVVDADDHVWVAFWMGGRVARYAPDGTCVRTVALPTPKTTKPAFGGADLDQLFVTSAFIETPAADLTPEAGALFTMPAGVRGRRPNIFRG